jgi:hypothetical protein
LIDADLERGRNAQEVPVECNVVDLAQRHAVGDNGITIRLGITDDVRRVERRCVLESANCATRGVRMKHLLTKDRLMQSLFRHPGRIDLFGCRDLTEVDTDLATGETQHELVL